MSSSARLKYKIVKCTSEDPEYPVSELLAHSSQTKGWQTARFCEFPQEIGLQFETPVHLRQVQFLSHQSKIATKVELFTALPAEGQNCRFEAATFKRLGYLSLDSNERSQFQARELKSVYVDVSAQFLRIVLHKCHVNRYNIVNQVGLIALHCSGEVLGPDLAVGPPPPNPALARSNAPDNAQASAPGQRAAAPADQGVARAAAAPSPPQAAPAASAEQAQDAAQAAADEMRYDERTLERIRALSTAKQRAVEAEDYEEAKRCKEMLTRLRQTGQLLRELEDRKRAAVQNEDYDAAKALKVEIDRLRSSLERPQNASDGRERGGGRASPTEQMTAPRGAHQPSMAQAPAANGGFDFDGLGGGQRAGSQGRLAAAPPESPLGSPHAGNGEAVFGSDAGAPLGGGPPGGGRGGGSSPTLNSYYGEPASQMPGPPMPFEGGAGEGGRASPPLMGGGGGGMQGRGSPPLPGAGGVPPGGERPGSSGGAPHAQGLERERSTPSEAAHHLRGVPNVEDILTSPEALPASMEKDKEVELLLQLFGDYITRCIFSKTWSLRDAALQKLALDLRDGARGGDEPGQLLQGYSAILRRTIADKNIQVMFSSGGLLQAVAQVLLEGGPARQREAQASLDPLMPLLVDRLGEPNGRVDKTARDALIDFARCQSVGATFVTQYLLRPPKKKTGVHARVYNSRLTVITALVTEFGVQPDGQCPLEATVQLAMEWFNNKDGEVRENSVKLVAACYMHVGLKRIEGYLANLRPAQREVFDQEFERAMASPSGPGQGGGRAQASARGGPRQDDGDGYGGLPAPAVPPPRRGGGGGGAAREPVCPPVSSGGYQQQDEGDFQEQELAEFTCQFCMRQDPSFTPEALDVHYWRECPMLTQCQFCQQVIEISTLRAHLTEECEAGPAAHAAGRDMLPHECPLCRADVGRAEDQDWIDHLLTVGCPNNPRSNGRGGTGRGQR